MRRSTAIAKIIESCLDDERTLVREAKLVDVEASAVLIRLAEERRRFSEELERLNGPNGRGGRGSWGALVRELRSELWVRASGRNTGDAIAVCRRSQQRTDVCYERVLKFEWPGEVRAALVAQHQRIHAARRELAGIEY